MLLVLLRPMHITYNLGTVVLSTIQPKVSAIVVDRMKYISAQS